MEPDSTLAFMAASIADSIDNYRDITGSIFPEIPD
jgi:hypothetical protein